MADAALKDEETIRTAAAAHPANLEEEKRLLAEKAALKVRMDTVDSVMAEYRRCSDEEGRLTKRIEDLTAHKAMLKQHYNYAMERESAARKLAEGLRYIEEAETTEAKYREETSRLQALQMEYQGAKAAFDAEALARKDKISALEAKARMLDDSQCIDVGNATCRFLMDAKKAKATLEQYRPECTAWKEAGLAALEDLRTRISTIQDALIRMNYDPSNLDSVRREVES